MKQQLIILSLLFWGCEAERATKEPEPEYYIEFTISTELIRSRAELVESYLDVENVGVYGFGEAKLLTNNMLLSRRLRDWYPESLLCWADCNTEPTTFFAYAPYATSENGITPYVSGNKLEMAYLAPLNAAHHPYLLVSFLVQKEVGNTSPVDFIMQHPLCAVSFLSQLPIVTIEVVGVATCATLSLADDGLCEWGDRDSFERSVSCELGEYMMMIPQELGERAVARVTLEDDQTLEFSLNRESWGVNERVDYTVVIDSLYRSTRRRELSP